MFGWSLQDIIVFIGYSGVYKGLQTLRGLKG